MTYPITAWFDNNNPKHSERAFKDNQKLMRADDDFGRYGTSLRIEASFLLVWNESVEGNERIVLRKFKETNKKISKWANTIMLEFGREVPVKIFPKIIYVHHETLFSIIFNVIMVKRKGIAVSILQRELIGLIERMIVYNITGDVRKIGDAAFRILDLRDNFFHKGKFKLFSYTIRFSPSP